MRSRSAWISPSGWLWLLNGFSFWTRRAVQAGSAPRWGDFHRNGGRYQRSRKEYHNRHDRYTMMIFGVLNFYSRVEARLSGAQNGCVDGADVLARRCVFTLSAHGVADAPGESSRRATTRRRHHKSAYILTKVRNSPNQLPISGPRKSRTMSDEHVEKPVSDVLRNAQAACGLSAQSKEAKRTPN